MVYLSSPPFFIQHNQYSSEASYWAFPSNNIKAAETYHVMQLLCTLITHWHFSKPNLFYILPVNWSVMCDDIPLCIIITLEHFYSHMLILMPTLVSQQVISYIMNTIKPPIACGN